MINQIKPKHSLQILGTSRLKYFGHIMCTAHSMEKDLMLGQTNGCRRGRQHTRWRDEIQGTMMMNWYDILTAIQGCGKQEMTKRIIRDNKTQYSLLWKPKIPPEVQCTWRNYHYYYKGTGNYITVIYCIIIIIIIIMAWVEEISKKSAQPKMVLYEVVTFLYAT